MRGVPLNIFTFPPPPSLYFVYRVLRFLVAPDRFLIKSVFFCDPRPPFVFAFGAAFHPSTKGDVETLEKARP